MITITEFPTNAKTSEPFVLKGTTTDLDNGDELLILVDKKFEVARARVQDGQWEITLIFNRGGDRLVEVIASEQDRSEITLTLESGEIEIISRSRWGAKPPKNSLADLRNPKRITIHHTALQTLSPTASTEAEERKMRNIQEGEMTNRGQEFDDIGYHYVIMPSGRIYEGRPNSKRGAHDKLNDGFGVVFDGSFQLDGSNITDAQFDSAVALCTMLCRKMKITDPTTLVSTPIKKQEKSSPQNLSLICGHRDRNDTLCPGIEEDRLEDLCQKVKERLA